MKEITDYQNKKVIVLGLAKSGVHAALLLHKLGALVTVNDIKPLSENPSAQELVEAGIRVIAGSHPLALLDEDFSVMVKNPGIPYTNPMVKRAQELNMPIITEPELAYEVLEGEFIGVTGTNGKTTTTTLINLMLNEGLKVPRSFVAGNIGVPASEVAQTIKADQTMVTELSSFQLLGTTELKPHIAVLTNIYEAHLDYHGNRHNYIEAKMNLVKNQTAADYFVINWDTEEWRELSQRTQAQVVPFSRQGLSHEGSYVQDGLICFKEEQICPAAIIKIPGQHNIENVLAAVAVAKIKGVSNEAIANVLRTFAGVRHRIQFVEEWQGRRFYNDSKATNIEATTVALQSFEQPIVLIAGGLDRGFVFDELVPLIKKDVKAMVVYGETADLMKDAGEKAGLSTIIKVDNLVEATQQAVKLSEPNEIVLLSPAAASWDQFKTFEDRGDLFIKTVEEITGKVEEQAK
ncbi:UDP-N-acetylmuramoyl-L-alanyl-D-glutamate synthetase [Lapidilactobacillus dextrinicus DSM 20335]|uniref:UDP-N-acetylmuramoylalanine--D-glutamate ligase n=1 Tax=Lapidilactobacillus dextrinicus DSM 20335 TaxID=1423738 RepID=A0A0R2BH49_9LACO|nr:UDP-N-acetylmuramoyl-L-alanine--D-glutamate ligase [Lapidilactobacillus dextrinicus]KRM78320.1 UDP-N-acetylmuramoyl-L-alanyl-D-glutamate synthetase [Lapidilactobacillus dextrinicus DSM 20335]QFG47313.1 UDP-N-acetylmuramoyl-L-alanine--D-glutamate ligase [Lapidilactobacillus dextrinicus]